MYYLWLLTFLCGAFLWNAYQTLPPKARHSRNFHLDSQQSLASIINKKTQILTKRPPVATTVPSNTNTVIGALVYRATPSDLRSRPKQSHHLSGALFPR